ncbi:MAG: FtsP/CotA-like multicopper oxidase with cupredoxin domain [Bacteriovoracaceae bacterium]|jgi:FtsP/CotA-like multicopper oxidase with cupredoxin domain
MESINRRSFLRAGVLGSCAAFAFPFNALKAGTKTQYSFAEANIIIELKAVKKRISVEVNQSTEFWCYEGRLIKGSQSNLVKNSGSYLGPTIQVRKGDRVKVIFKNGLEEKSIIHWHGLDVSHENDGHPHNAIEPGASFDYDFEVTNRSGMYWYHPHPHGRTGAQVYHGLAGLFIVRDNEEAILNLPNKEQELQLVIQDRSFDESGELDYRPSMMGAFGNVLMINGKKNNKIIKVKKGKYRLRFLNGCNARVFNFGMDDKSEFMQIGSDGGLLEKAIKLKRFYFAPAERFDCIVDFSKNKTGDIIGLDSLPLVEGRGEKYNLLKFEVIDGEVNSFEVPLSLSAYKKILSSEAINESNPKEFELIGKRGIGWTINGRGYEEDNYTKDEIIDFGNTEIWEFYNPTGMPHPMHIHGTQFQVLSRSVGRLEGALDQGWKDVVLVMPGDRVRVIKRFNTFKGTFIYHCHNLEHEDMSMMRNFKVV